jgi:diadenosine tetraphosphate (Ap4A) HIT family hydrolase
LQKVSLYIILELRVSSLCAWNLAATSNPQINILSNQGYGQTVPHLHFHLIPAPDLDKKQTKRIRFTFGMNREELDDDEGKIQAENLKECIERELTKAKL